MVFDDDSAWNQDIYVTKKVPYANPAKRTLNKKEKETVDNFLDVFFDAYNKQAFICRDAGQVIGKNHMEA